MKRNNEFSDENLIICRCEEITKLEIKNAIREGYATVNDIRKRTRAGMGFCQGKTCEKLVRQIIEENTDKAAADILPSRTRPPVRPIEACVFAAGCDEIESGKEVLS